MDIKLVSRRAKVIFLIIMFAICSCSSDYEIYISTSGNDNNSGSISEPIKSLHHAAKLIRENAGKVPVTIYLTGGIYSLTEPLEMDASISGNIDAAISWKAIKNEKPVISGGITVSNWKEENNGLWSAHLPETVKNEFRSFYMNDKRAIRARFPNNSFLRIERAGSDKRTNFYFKKDDLPRITNISGLEIVFLHDWSISRISVADIDWGKNKLTAVDSIGSRLDFFKIDNWEKQPRYFLENSQEFCDAPGEWYCDFSKRQIFYHPFQDEEITNANGVIPISENLLILSGNEKEYVEHISFEGITFAYSSFTLPESGYCGIQACMFTNRSSAQNQWDKIPAAIELNSAKNILFKNCKIKHTGGSGIWIGSRSKNCEILECEISDISGNGVNIGEGRSRLVDGMPWWQKAPEEAATNNKVVNSIIKDCGKQFYGAVGIWSGLVAQTLIANNDLSDLPYTGISIGWMWDTTSTPCRQNIIKSNHIHNVMNILSDGGGIYSLGQQPGSIIAGNLIHDVKINAGRAESNGMFLDEGTRDLIVENNIIYNISMSPIRFHKAFNNLVQHNVMVCKDEIPPIRYNNTNDTLIQKVNNRILSQSSQEDNDLLNTILKESKDNFGPVTLIDL